MIFINFYLKLFFKYFSLSYTATEFISDKTNEIPTGIELLKRVNIKNCVITFYTMSTQINTIEYIASNHLYYVASVKGN